MEKKLFKTIQCPDVVSFESAVEELLNDGWKLINANSLALHEGSDHRSQSSIYVHFHAFLLKEGEACQPEPVEGTSSISSIVNPKS